MGSDINGLFIYLQFLCCKKKSISPVLHQLVFGHRFLSIESTNLECIAVLYAETNLLQCLFLLVFNGNIAS